MEQTGYHGRDKKGDPVVKQAVKYIITVHFGFRGAVFTNSDPWTPSNPIEKLFFFWCVPCILSGNLPRGNGGDADRVLTGSRVLQLKEEMRRVGQACQTFSHARNEKKGLIKET